ncbi:TetR/AcrR family transcriptional regulator [Aeromicrobium sp. A1-2]|uniref:TetR/AcrR family transcriptional regulator n=1 Tax=Aeromicrobium sp. A1-2 TaxID=2107713 RepID=UPI000E495C6C|nr:TetR/AcrR family transcriptional regulator [Aeromicrobium sp. A1-2]AXT85022.1 TetR/AcrR family transcriptional regulator [Aeromicrobium sp. A1-2]
MHTSEKATIGRPRLFDEEAVLAELTGLFWRQGYGQTSMADIVQASGVHKPSLYRIFGTKEELFAIVLRRYLAERIAMFAALIEQSGPGVAGIHRFLDGFELDATSPHGRNGCLMVMASNELHGKLPDYDFAADYRQQMREQIATLVARAVPEGSADTELTQARTDLFTAYLLGLQVIMRSDARADEIHQYLHAMHVTIDTW